MLAFICITLSLIATISELSILFESLLKIISSYQFNDGLSANFLHLSHFFAPTMPSIHSLLELAGVIDEQSSEQRNFR